MLAYQPCIVVFVQWDNANGSVFKVDFSVDALAAGRVDHLVLLQLDPWIFIDILPGQCFPGILTFFLFHYDWIFTPCPVGVNELGNSKLMNSFLLALIPC